MASSNAQTETIRPAEDDRLRVLFALLYSSPDPVSLTRIHEVVYGTDEEAAREDRRSPRQLCEALQGWVLARDLPLEVVFTGRHVRLLTTPDVAGPLESVRRKVHADRLGPAALEVLALVAYRQPVLKADVDAIRGVRSGPHLRHLLDLRLVRIIGRAELPGRPFLYGTTSEFLDRFGLRTLDELPQADLLKAPAEQEPHEKGADKDPAAEPSQAADEPRSDTEQPASIPAEEPAG